jgi:hypothetical protein
MDVENGPGTGDAQPADEATAAGGSTPAAAPDEDWSDFAAPRDETTSSGDGRSGETGTMTVEVGGRARQLPAEHDFTGDGQPDAAVETGDGKVIVFADVEDNATGDAGPDGRADQAYVVDKATGRVVGAAHVDPETGGWVDESPQDGGS